MTNDERDIEDLVARFIERREQGEALTPETFVGEYGSDDEVLLAALRRLAETEDLFPSEPVTLPESIGRYRVVEEIGRGGVGIVLRAIETGSGDVVAIKVLSLTARINPRALRRFRREGDVLARLDDPRIVGVREIGAVEGSPYIVMDFVEGKTASRVVAQARQRLQEDGVPRGEALVVGEQRGTEAAVSLAIELGEAIASAHREGILHRDLKPGNIVVRPNGRPVLLDFGLVGTDDRATPMTPLTRTGDVLGTPQYMAPEQAAGQATSERTDVYGVGVVLYELLTLRPPYDGAGLNEILTSVRDDALPGVRETVLDLPADLDRIVRVATARRPEDRYPTMDHLVADLRAFQAGSTVRARLGFAVRLRAFGRRRRRALTMAAGLLGIAALAWLAYHAFANNDNDPALRPSAITGLPDATWSDDAVAMMSSWLDRDDEKTVSSARACLAVDENDSFATFLFDLASDEKPRNRKEPGFDDLYAGIRRRKRRQSKQALYRFQEAGHHFPRHPIIDALEGRTALDLEHYDRAEKLLERARRTLTGCRFVAVGLADIKIKRREFREAIPGLEAELARRPEDIGLWSRLVRCQLYAGEYASGLNSVYAAMEVLDEKGISKVANTFGAMLDSNERHGEAQSLYRRLLRIRPDRESTRWNLALSFDLQHRSREAADEYLRLAESTADSPLRAKCHAALAHLYSGALRSACPKCVAVYEANPDLLDPDKTLTHAVATLEACNARDTNLIRTAAGAVVRIGRGEDFRRHLEQRLAALETRDDTEAETIREHLRAGLRIVDRGRQED